VNIFFLYHKEYSRAIDLNLIISTYETSGLAFPAYVDSFNEYSKKNNLNINLNMHLLTRDNFSFTVDNASLMFEYLLKKKKTAYDIYFFDGSWSHHYCPYFVDLRDYIEEDQFNLYNKNIITQLNRCDDKIIGIV